MPTRTAYAEVAIRLPNLLCRVFWEQGRCETNAERYRGRFDRSRGAGARTLQGGI